VELQLVAQSIISELVQEYNTLTEYRAGLLLHPCYPEACHDDAIAEAMQSAYKDAIGIVARQARITISFTRETVPVKGT
jgi:hypothetical protein